MSVHQPKGDSSSRLSCPPQQIIARLDLHFAQISSFGLPWFGHLWYSRQVSSFNPLAAKTVINLPSPVVISDNVLTWRYRWHLFICCSAPSWYHVTGRSLSESCPILVEASDLLLAPWSSLKTFLGIPMCEPPDTLLPRIHTSNRTGEIWNCQDPPPPSLPQEIVAASSPSGSLLGIPPLAS